MVNSKTFFSALVVVIGVLLVFGFGFRSERPEKVTHANTQGISHELVVYRSPTCGCCTNWEAYMRSRGYKVDSIDVADANLDDIKEEYGVPEAFYACHTTVVNGGQYFIEGLMPVEAVDRLLEEEPDIAGIGLPGMPSGAPGMSGNQEAPFEILQVDGMGEIGLYQVI